MRIAARKSGRERRWKMRLVRVDRHMPAKKVESVELSQASALWAPSFL